MESGGAAMAFLLWDKKIKIFLWQKPKRSFAITQCTNNT